VRIFLDNCLPYRLKPLFAGHEVFHARDLGWRDLSNGKLVAAAAENGYELLVTIDKNIRHQHNMALLPISILELDAFSNSLKVLSLFAPHFPRAVEQSRRFRFVSLKIDGAMESLVPRTIG
jgi:predicted nuclease of predicted toxin-antitoxin system